MCSIFSLFTSIYTTLISVRYIHKFVTGISEFVINITFYKNLLAILPRLQILSFYCRSGKENFKAQIKEASCLDSKDLPQCLSFVSKHPCNLNAPLSAFLEEQEINSDVIPSCWNPMQDVVTTRIILLWHIISGC